jgi:histone H3/H4
VTNPRLQNIKESTFGWRFKISHCPGKWQRGPDALSRYPSQNPCIAAVNQIETTQKDTDTEDPVPSVPASLFHLICEEPTESDIQAMNATSEYAESVFINAISAHSETVSIEDVKQEARADNQYRDLIELIENGFPKSRSKVQPTHLREFWGVHDRLSCVEDVALMDSRVVIPRSLRKQILANLHAANQGVSGMKARANQTVYWPGMDAQMRNFKDSCADCLENSPSQKAEPLMLTPSPEWPFQQICADYFELMNRSYLSIVDRFSAWLCIYHMKSGELTSQALISICRDLFIQYGVAEEISSDGGPQFTAKVFQDFLTAWNVKHRLSSVGYPQSNGRAEAAVKAAKRIIHNNVSPSGSLDNDKVACAILQYRNTPLPDINLSPAQILFHRQLKDGVPAVPSHYALHKEWVLSAKQRESALAARTQKIIENHNKSARELGELSVGTNVVVQSRDQRKKKWVKSGKIVEVLDNRQYRIRMDGSGRVTLQNRRFIKECHPITPPMPAMSPSLPMTSPQQPAPLQIPQQTARQMLQQTSQQVLEHTHEQASQQASKPQVPEQSPQIVVQQVPQQGEQQPSQQVLEKAPQQASQPQVSEQPQDGVQRVPHQAPRQAQQQSSQESPEQAPQQESCASRKQRKTVRKEDFHMNLRSQRNLGEER